MSKDSRKQIIEQTRNSVSKDYHRKIEELKARIRYLSEENESFIRKYYEARHGADSLREKVSQLEDWNRRLMEYMDMDENQRLQELAMQRQRADNERAMDRLFSSPLIRMAEQMFNF